MFVGWEYGKWENSKHEVELTMEQLDQSVT